MICSSPSLSLSAGCQVCGGEEEAAAGLPSHGDEQTDPDTARVHSPPHQRDPAVSAAFLSVSGHIRACSIYNTCAFVCRCARVCERLRRKMPTRVCRCRTPVCERMMQGYRDLSGGVQRGTVREREERNQGLFLSTANSNIWNPLYLCL